MIPPSMLTIFEPSGLLFSLAEYFFPSWFLSEIDYKRDNDQGYDLMLGSSRNDLLISLSRNNLLTDYLRHH